MDKTATAPETTAAAAQPKKIDLGKAAIKDAIAKGKAIIKEGKSKADAAMVIFDVLKDEEKDVVTPSDTPEEGEPVEITGGIVGKIVRDNFRNTSRFIFRVADVEYTFALSADASDDVASSNSALKLGSIPVDAFASESKLARSVPDTSTYAPPPTYTPPSQTYTPPTQAYTPPTRNAWECNASYTVSLQTFGEGVTVELRQGSPGNSRVIKTSYSSGGNVFFSGLCPGSYFLAIGNGESVSVTPVRLFETGIDYTSTLTMQRGTGNVSSRRKSDL